MHAPINQNIYLRTVQVDLMWYLILQWISSHINSYLLICCPDWGIWRKSSNSEKVRSFTLTTSNFPSRWIWTDWVRCSKSVSGSHSTLLISTMPKSTRTIWTIFITKSTTNRPIFCWKEELLYSHCCTRISGSLMSLMQSTGRTPSISSSAPRSTVAWWALPVREEEVSTIDQ